MGPMAISWIAFGCIFGGALLGMVLRSRLLESHLSSDSKDVIKLAMCVLGTMEALVLALLINSAKTSHDTQSGEMMQMAADFISLDRVMADYGPQTKEARQRLRALVAPDLVRSGVRATTEPRRWIPARREPAWRVLFRKYSNFSRRTTTRDRCMHRRYSSAATRREYGRCCWSRLRAGFQSRSWWC